LTATRRHRGHRGKIGYRVSGPGYRVGKSSRFTVHGKRGRGTADARRLTQIFKVTINSKRITFTFSSSRNEENEVMYENI
jgi:hypothetical protein